MGYGPRGLKESDLSERLTPSLSHLNFYVASVGSTHCYRWRRPRVVPVILAMPSEGSLR